MSWKFALELLCVLWVGSTVILLIVGRIATELKSLNRRNRIRRGILPPPSDKTVRVMSFKQVMEEHTRRSLH